MKHSDKRRTNLNYNEARVKSVKQSDKSSDQYDSLAGEWNYVPGLQISEEPACASLLQDKAHRPVAASASEKHAANDTTASAKEASGATYLHTSHTWRSCAAVVFCWRCGVRFTRRGEGVPKSASQRVTQQCQGDAAIKQGKLCRLRKGQHPETGKWMAPVIKADLAGLVDPAVR